MSRIGKIARLPARLRLEINHRLRDGQKAIAILAWVNAHEEARTLLAREFDKPEITDGNLSDWRKGGYREWEAQEAAIDAARSMVSSAKELEETSPKSLADRLAVWVTARYIMATRQLMGNNLKRNWKLLRELCHDITALRRGDHGAEWLRLENERVKLLRQKNAREKRKERDEANPPLPPMDEAEKERRFREIFGMEQVVL